MSTENKNLPAFPVAEHDFKRFQNELPLWTGLTKREVFAAMAMQSFITNKGVTTFDAARNTEDVLGDISAASVAMADAIINQLNNPMTESNKAKGDELIEKFLKWTHGNLFAATQCAIIAVEEIIENHSHRKGHTIEEFNYWHDVLTYLKSKL